MIKKFLHYDYQIFQSVFLFQCVGGLAPQEIFRVLYLVLCWVVVCLLVSSACQYINQISFDQELNHHWNRSAPLCDDRRSLWFWLLARRSGKCMTKKLIDSVIGRFLVPYPRRRDVVWGVMVACWAFVWQEWNGSSWPSTALRLASESQLVVGPLSRICGSCCLAAKGWDVISGNAGLVRSNGNDFILAGWIWCWSSWVFWPCLWFRSWRLKPAFPLKSSWWSGACAYFAWWEPWGWVHFDGLNARDDGAICDWNVYFIVINCVCFS